jgi:hypothetical protein
MDTCSRTWRARPSSWTPTVCGDYGIEDHFQYFDPKSGKFFILPWDPDGTFGSTGEKPDRGIYARFSRSKLSLAVRDAGNFRADKGEDHRRHGGGSTRTPSGEATASTNRSRQPPTRIP